MVDDLAARMGLRIRRARIARGWRQADLADIVSVSQSTICRMELGRGVQVPLDTWLRVATALGLVLTFDLVPSRIARQESDQQRCHRLVTERALTGGWAAWTTGDETVLERPERREVAIVRIWDVIGDVGAAVRALERRLATERSERGDGWRISGLVVVTPTGHNRRRLSESGGTVNQAFPVRGARWLIALGGGPMPDGAGMLWTSSRMERLRPFLPYLDHRCRQRSRARRPTPPIGSMNPARWAS